MKLSEFVRGISEIDVVLGRLTGFTCTKSGCEGEWVKWVTCDRVDEEKIRKLLNKLRKLGLPDLPAELGKVVGRPVTADDLCVFWGTHRLYLDCAFPGASEERCRKEYRRVLKEARERFKNIPELKKRLENLLRKLDGVGWFEFKYFFVGRPAYLRIPLNNCDTELELKYDPLRKDFEVRHYLPILRPELSAWFTEAVEDTLRSLGLGRYRTTTTYGKVEIRLRGPNPGAALDLFETFAGLAPALDDVCAALPVRHLAGKTKERVKV